MGWIFNSGIDGRIEAYRNLPYHIRERRKSNGTRVFGQTPPLSFFSDIKGDLCDQLDAAEDVAEMDLKVKLKTCESVFLDLLTFFLARPGPHSDHFWPIPMTFWLPGKSVSHGLKYVSHVPKCDLQRPCNFLASSNRAAWHGSVHVHSVTRIEESLEVGRSWI